jgi:hypothetical protein
MHKRFQSVALGALVIALSGIGTTRADEEVELFNGKDLSGWTKRGAAACRIRRTLF